jgi:hypothetical protein
MDSVFTIADIWTSGIDAKEYRDFLTKLYQRVTIHRTKGASWKNVQNAVMSAPRPALNHLVPGAIAEEKEEEDGTAGDLGIQRQAMEDSEAMEIRLKIAHRIGTKEMLARADDAFANIDEDGDGDVDITEFKKAMSRMDVLHSKQDDKLVQELFEDIDIDGNGTVDLEEFKQMQQQSAKLLLVEEEMTKTVYKDEAQKEKKRPLGSLSKKKRAMDKGGNKVTAVVTPFIRRKEQMVLLEGGKMGSLRKATHRVGGSRAAVAKLGSKKGTASKTKAANRVAGAAKASRSESRRSSIPFNKDEGVTGWEEYTPFSPSKRVNHAFTKGSKLTEANRSRGSRRGGKQQKGGASSERKCSSATMLSSDDRRRRSRLPSATGRGSVDSAWSDYSNEDDDDDGLPTNDRFIPAENRSVPSPPALHNYSRCIDDKSNLKHPLEYLVKEPVYTLSETQAKVKRKITATKYDRKTKEQLDIDRHNFDLRRERQESELHAMATCFALSPAKKTPHSKNAYARPRARTPACNNSSLGEPQSPLQNPIQNRSHCATPISPLSQSLSQSWSPLDPDRRSAPAQRLSWTPPVLAGEDRSQRFADALQLV